MKAIVYETYGSSGGARGTGHREAAGRRWRGPGPRARGVRPRRRLDPHDRQAVRHAHGHRPACAEEPRSRDGHRRDRGGGRQGRATTSAGRRGVRLVRRRICRVRERAGGPVHQEARQPHVRAGGGRRRFRHDGPPAASRQRQGQAGSEGACQRGVGRCRLVRRADRQGAWSRGDRRDEHEECRPRPLDRCGPRDRLHPRGLHRGCLALRPHLRQRGQSLDGPDQARPEPDGDPHLERRGAQRRQARPHPADDARLAGRAWPGRSEPQDAEPR